MTNDVTTHQKKSPLHGIVKIVAAAVLAFIAALLFRQSAGIIAMTPLALVIFAVIAFIDIKTVLKLVINGITVFAVNTVEQEDFKTTLIFTTLCLLATIVFELVSKLFKKNKKAAVALACAGAVLCVSLNVFFIGNPFEAFVAKSSIKEYIREKYPEDESTDLGNFKFGSIYYDFGSKRYGIDAVSSKYPTEGGFISYNGRVNDSFEGIMADKLCEPYCLEMVSLLRKYFPNESFTVKCDGIASMPGQNVLALQEDQLRNAITFEITLSGVQTANRMTAKVENYIKVIDGSEIGYAKIIFKSGTGIWARRSITVESNRPEGFGIYKMSYVNVYTSNRFNRFVSYLAEECKK